MKIRKSQLANMNIIYKFFSFDYFLDHTERMGYEAIEILPTCPHFYIDDLTMSEIKALKKKIQDHHLKVACYTPDQCSYPHNISYQSEVSRKRTLRTLEKQLEITSLLECDQMLSTSGYGYFDEPREDAWGRMVDSLQILARKAQTEGVTIVLEPIRTDETNLVYDLPTLKQALQDIGSPYVKGMLDTSPMWYAGESIAQYARELGDDLYHIHLIDGKPAGHLAWGDGIFPLDEYIKDITDAGYDRYLTIELTAAQYFLEPNPAMEQCMQALSRYF